MLYEYYEESVITESVLFSEKTKSEEEEEDWRESPIRSAKKKI